MTSEPVRHDQTLCWNCEEVVHTHASQCPYCKVQLKHSTKATHVVSSGDKITPLPAALPQAESSFPSPKEESHALGNTILSICLLFGGCNLLFLGILVGLFSRNGTFSLSWAEAHWPIYFGAGIAFVAFGLIAMSAIDQKKE